MTWTTERTWVNGEVPTDSIFNTHLRDNMNWVATDAPYAFAYRTAALSLTNVTTTAIAMTSERFDNATVHDTVTNTARLTVPTGAAGKWLFGANLEYANSAGGTTRNCDVRLGGATTIGIANVGPNASAVARVGAGAFYSMAVGDYVECTGYQDSGGALNTNVSGNATPVLWGFLVRL